ncbi:hypothetical protein CRUP_022145 [Coryphaenoides rupestris]|nr:hypothetical protein CRUP_022145 [Coryphaenoides rupestris]
MLLISVSHSSAHEIPVAFSITKKIESVLQEVEFSEKRARSMDINDFMVAELGGRPLTEQSWVGVPSQSRARAELGGRPLTEQSWVGGPLAELGGGSLTEPELGGRPLTEQSWVGGPLAELGGGSPHRAELGGRPLTEQS